LTALVAFHVGIHLLVGASDKDSATECAGLYDAEARVLPDTALGVSVEFRGMPRRRKK